MNALSLLSPDQREIANKALRKGSPSAWRFSDDRNAQGRGTIELVGGTAIVEERTASAPLVDIATRIALLKKPLFDF